MTIYKGLATVKVSTAGDELTTGRGQVLVTRDNIDAALMMHHMILACQMKMKMK